MPFTPKNYKLSAQIASADQHHTILIPAPEDLPQDLEQAEAIQDNFLNAYNYTVKQASGWKVGASNKASRIALGLPRAFYGFVAPKNILEEGAKVPLHQIRQYKAEGEIAVTLNTNIAEFVTSDSHPLSAEQAFQCIASAHAAIEIPQSRFESLNQYGPLALVADNGAAGFIILGSPNNREILLNSAISQAKITSITPLGEERLVEYGATDFLIDSPLQTLADHLNLRIQRNCVPCAEDIILLGAITPCIDTFEGELIRVEIENYGNCTIRF